MILLLQIAFRNITRNKRRSFLTSATVAVGIAVFIFLDSMYAGIDRGGLTNIVNLTNSALTVYSEEYSAEKTSFPLDYGINNPKAVMRFLKEKNEVTAVTKQTRFIGKLSDNSNSYPVFCRAVDPETYTDVFAIEDYIREGTWPGGAAYRGENYSMVVGAGLAEDFGVSAGDSLQLTAQTRDGSPAAARFKIAGVFKTSSARLNNQSVFLPYSAADELLNLHGLITEINTSIPWETGLPFEEYAQKVEKVNGKLKNEFPGLSTVPVKEAAADFLALSRADQATASVMFGIILLIAAVGIINSVLLSVYERVREIGILRSLGFNGKEILMLFSFEGMIIGFAGSVLGLCFGAGLNCWLVYSGLDLSAISETIAGMGIPMATKLHGVWNSNAYITAFVFGTALSFFAGIIPARKASSIEVTEAMRFQ